FSPGATHLAVVALAANDDWELQLWDLGNNHEVWKRTTSSLTRPSAYTPFPDALAFSPDGRLIADGGPFTSRVQLWEARTGSPRGQLIGHQGPTVALTFSPDGG